MTRVNFFVDPACPWTWITSRWLVSIAPERNLEIRWRSFSTEVRDGEIRLPEAIPEHVRTIARARREMERTVLGVFEIVRRQHGEAAVGRFYAELGYRLNDPNCPMAAPSKGLIASALAAAGLETELERLAGDPDLQASVRESTEEALAIVGQGAMAPVLTLGQDGLVGISGPVLSEVPTHDTSLRLWDSVLDLLENAKFLELRRARSQPPQFPLRLEGFMATSM
jgi:2-hydroxychromene-2-carboxylate isomerase